MQQENCSTHFTGGLVMQYSLHMKFRGESISTAQQSGIAVDLKNHHVKDIFIFILLKF